MKAIGDNAEVDKKFGEIIVRTCSFCNKTFDVDKFYEIPNHDSNLQLFKATLYSTIGKSERKEVNDGICLKCILKGLLKICKNDKEEINDILSLYLKDKIIDSLEDKK